MRPGTKTTDQSKTYVAYTPIVSHAVVLKAHRAPHRRSRANSRLTSIASNHPRTSSAQMNKIE